LLLFSVPRVMFDGLEPFAAMKESLAASLANFGAIVLCGTCFLLSALLAFIPFALVPILGWIVWGLGVSAMGAAVMYVAYRDVYGAAPAADATAPASPSA